MYDTKFLCTYQLLEDDDAANELYQIQFLQAFGLDDWNDELVGKEIDALFATMKDLQLIETGIEKLRSDEQIACLLAFTGNDDETAFRLFFGYDMFYIMHKCICELSNDGVVSDKSSESFLNKL